MQSNKVIVLNSNGNKQKYIPSNNNLKVGRKRFKYRYMSKHYYNSSLSSLKNKSGVYCLHCKTTDHTYVGSSTNLGVRLGRYNQPSYVLNYKASSKICQHIAMYGSNSFTFYILQYSDSKNTQVLTVMEQHWINLIMPKLNTKINIHPATFVKYNNTL